MILIQCTRSKRDESAEARNLYDESNLFRKMKRYAELKGQYKILSAKHGLLDPEEEIEPYDEFGLTETQGKEIAEEIDADTVEVIAGKAYTNVLIPELEALGIDVINNFAGMRIGKRMQKLDMEIKKLENETLC